jgi:hypothetical protein
MNVPVAIGLLLAILWCIFGSPGETVANWFWPNEPAPWEDVDAVYYPDRNNLYSDIKQPHVGSLARCREWVHAQAAFTGDPDLERGDYECGVGFLRSLGDLSVYRLTLR